MSTIGRQSSFTISMFQPNSANGNSTYERPRDGDDDVFPPSRCSSFSSTSSSQRRTGVVNERQLDSLQRRLVHWPPMTNTEDYNINNSSPAVTSSIRQRALSVDVSSINYQHQQHFNRTTTQLMTRRYVRDGYSNTVNLPPSSSTSSFISSNPLSHPTRRFNQVTSNHWRTGVEYVDILDKRLNNYRPTQPSGPSLDDVAVESKPGLKHQLAEREAELKSLRETMERNERAILRVIEDKRHRADQEAAEWRLKYTQQLNEMSAKAFKEQQLSEAIERLQIENIHLKTVLDTTRDHLTRVQQQERNGSKIILPTKLNVVNKPGMLPLQSTDSDQSSKANNAEFLYSSNEQYSSRKYINGTKSDSENTIEINKVNSPLLDDQNVQQENQTNHLIVVNLETGNEQIIESAELESVEKCQRCVIIKDQMYTERAKFNSERSRWLEEKERVVAYQKLLQIGYRQLINRCKEL